MNKLIDFTNSNKLSVTLRDDAELIFARRFNSIPLKPTIIRLNNEACLYTSVRSA